MPKPEKSLIWWALPIGVIGVLLLIGSCPRDDTNHELARTAREAVKMAREARADDRSAIMWSSRYRLIAQVIGVTVPIVVAYLIWRSSNKGKLDAVEILNVAERFTLTDQTSSGQSILPTDDCQRSACANTDAADKADSTSS